MQLLPFHVEFGVQFQVAFNPMQPSLHVVCLPCEHNIDLGICLVIWWNLNLLMVLRCCELQRNCRCSFHSSSGSLSLPDVDFICSFSLLKKPCSLSSHALFKLCTQEGFLTNTVSLWGAAPHPYVFHQARSGLLVKFMHWDVMRSFKGCSNLYFVISEWYTSGFGK